MPFFVVGALVAKFLRARLGLLLVAWLAGRLTPLIHNAVRAYPPLRGLHRVRPFTTRVRRRVQPFLQAPQPLVAALWLVFVTTHPLLSALGPLHRLLARLLRLLFMPFILVHPQTLDLEPLSLATRDRLLAGRGWPLLALRSAFRLDLPRKSSAAACPSSGLAGASGAVTAPASGLVSSRGNWAALRRGGPSRPTTTAIKAPLGAARPRAAAPGFRLARTAVAIEGIEAAARGVLTAGGPTAATVSTAVVTTGRTGTAVGGARTGAGASGPTIAPRTLASAPRPKGPPAG